MSILIIILSVSLGTILGMVVASIFAASKEYDSELLMFYIKELSTELKEEEEINTLLRQANESLRDDYNKLKQIFDENFFQLEEIKSRFGNNI